MRLSIDVSIAMSVWKVANPLIYLLFWDKTITFAG